MVSCGEVGPGRRREKVGCWVPRVLIALQSAVVVVAADGDDGDDDGAGAAARCSRKMGSWNVLRVQMAGDWGHDCAVKIEKSAEKWGDRKTAAGVKWQTVAGQVFLPSKTAAAPPAALQMPSYEIFREEAEIVAVAAAFD